MSFSTTNPTMGKFNDPSDPSQLPEPNNFASSSYQLSGKIMLAAIIVLFFVVILMVFLHLYARWYLLRARRRYLNRRRSRNHNTNSHGRANLVFYADPSVTLPNSGSAPKGLDPAVLKSLPVFIYSPQTHPEGLDCAVCLSEFEGNEIGRVLPKCKHSFHIECIDMWFHSHSTCPLCRAPVEPPPPEPERNDFGKVAITVIPVEDTGSSSSGLCESCRDGLNETGTSTTSFEERSKKPLAIQVPGRSVNGFEDESTRSDSPASQQSFRSPMSRMLSLKRILSRERRNGGTPSSSSHGTAISPPSFDGGLSVAESDIEAGIHERR